MPVHTVTNDTQARSGHWLLLTCVLSTTSGADGESKALGSVHHFYRNWKHWFIWLLF